MRPTLKVGDRVIGGTINRTGAFRYRATTLGSDSVLAQIVRIMREAQGSHAPIQRLADRVSAVFVPVVLVIATVTFCLWLFVPADASAVRALTAAVSVIDITTRAFIGDDAVPLPLLTAPGAYAEQVIAQESLMLPVPNGLGPDIAALTEPMAVAWHAVRRGEVGKRQVAIVIGCGPVGLLLIRALRAVGAGRVVATDRLAHRVAAALSSASTQLSTMSQSLSSGTSRQAETTEEVTSNLARMNVSISQNAESSRRVEALALDR